MQLENTLITVRNRDNYDLLDLTIIVMRSNFLRYLQLAAIGWLPWLILDFLLLLPIAGINIQDFESIRIFDQTSLYLRFIYLFSLLFILQAPFALIPLTFYIGQEMFQVRPTFKDALKNYGSHLWLKIVSLGVRGGIVPASILVAITTYSNEYQPAIESFFLPVVLFLPVMIWRSIRPFAPEVISLEQTRSIDGQALNRLERSKAYRRRMKSLHQIVASELFVRFIYVGLIGIGLTVLLGCSVLWFLQIISPDVEWTWLHCFILVPSVYLVVSVFTTIFRFISYIDTRILLEGWEVRLRFISEAERIRIE